MSLVRAFIISITGLLLCFFLLRPFSKPSTSDWMDRAIARDFKRYEKGGISKALLEKTWRVCKKHKEFHRYQIIHSQVYGPESRIKILLEEIVRHYPVPDVDFILLTARKPSALALGGNAAPLLKCFAMDCIAHDLSPVEMTVKTHRGILLLPRQYLA